MIEKWIRKYFPEEQVPEVLTMLSEYGTEKWHNEVERVHRDIVILSRGSMTSLRAAIDLAKTDCRDILIGEQIDPWVIGELGKAPP